MAAPQHVEAKCMSDNTNSGPASLSLTPSVPVPAAAPAGSPGRAAHLHGWARRCWAWMRANVSTLVLAALMLGAGGSTWWWARSSYFQQFGGIEPLGASATDQRAAWGQFGDYMGGVVNPLLSLLTLLALVATVALQRQQLQISRAELKATRKELKKSARAQRKAAKAMKGQLKQARLTAQAQTEAALHQLATAKAMQEQAEYTKVSARVAALVAWMPLAREEAEDAERRVNARKSALSTPNHATDKELLALQKRFGDCFEHEAMLKVTLEALGVEILKKEGSNT